MKLALGTAQFGLNYGIANDSGQISFNQVARILKLAHSRGVAYLDTAINYGDAEHRLGKIGVDKFSVTTKLPPCPDELPNKANNVEMWIREHLEKSLERLKLKNLYGLLLHRPADLFGKNGNNILRCLEQCKYDGLIEKLGISIYDPSELKELMSLKIWDLVQAPLNIIDRRMVSSGWLTRLHDMGIEVHIRSVFMQGLLLKSSNDLPKQFSQWSHIWNEWDRWQSISGYSAIKACLAYVNSLPGVDRVVVGVDSLVHLSEILDIFDAKPAASWPSISCEDDALVNPSRWSQL